MMSGTRFAKSPKIRAILRELGEATACRIWRKTYDIGASRPGYPKAVAKRSGMNRSYLSRLESDRRNPTLATLERLAKILNVAPGYFL
jgi:transcriptional regulator with XRE-family HTH domain